jgi:hypothetical protein
MVVPKVLAYSAFIFAKLVCSSLSALVFSIIVLVASLLASVSALINSPFSF